MYNLEELVADNKRLRNENAHLNNLLEQWVRQYGKVEKMNEPLATEMTASRKRLFVKKNKQQ